MTTFRSSAFAKRDTALPQVAEQVTTTKPARANKFAARCVECSGNVPEGAGSLDKVGDKWVVKHFPACPEVDQTLQVAQNADESVAPEAKQTIVKGKVVFDGVYTYETISAHRTFRLRTQGTADSFMPGTQILQVLTGKDNEHDYQSIGHVKTNGVLSIWKKHQDRSTLVKDAQAFMADPHGDDVLAAVQCYRCHRTLTVPASIHNGLGPECSKR